MKKLLSLIFPAALILAATNVEAADMRSRIKNVDLEAQTFTLRNGITFRINENVPVEELVPGTSVKVKYKTERGQRHVRKVIIRGSGNS